MRFIIIGAGAVGLRTARVLSQEGHEVVIVEQDTDAVARARSAGFDTIEGDGSNEAVLETAEIGSTDAIGALSSDLNANFAACMVAKHHGCRTVMRVDRDYREEIYRDYADEVDELIYPERLGAVGAKNALVGGNIRAIADIAQELQILLIEIPSNSPLTGYTLSEVELPGRARMLAFGKKDNPLDIPLSGESLEAGDRIAVLADFDVLDEVRQLLGREQTVLTGAE
ncbi:MAG: K+ transport system, NAD-binding component [uncultured archaeon A07HR60]|nr:MAG: K+ transport system, NAD-binding component [uncultured archaeon A07HR60]